MRAAPTDGEEIVERLNSEINTILADPKFKARLAEFGGTPLAGSSADFGRLLVDKPRSGAR
jgi:hypothetical protein